MGKNPISVREEAGWPQGCSVVFVKKKNNFSGQGFETRTVQLRNYADYPIAAPNYGKTSE